MNGETKMIDDFLNTIEELEQENTKLIEIVNQARKIIERAYFDPFDPFHSRLEYSRIDWLNNNQENKNDNSEDNQIQEQ